MSSMANARDFAGSTAWGENEVRKELREVAEIASQALALSPFWTLNIMNFRKAAFRLTY